MSNNPRFVKKRLCQFVAAGLLLGAGSSVYANDFSLTSNQFTISETNASDPDFSVTATLGSDGVLDTTGANLPQFDLSSSTLNTGIPTFSFTIDSSGLDANTTHNFKIGLSISDDASPTTRRFEAFLGTLTLAVDGSKNVTGTIPSQNLQVRAKKGSATFYQAINNPSANGPVSISGGTITLSGSEAVTLLKAQGNDALDAVLDSFTLNGAFTFRVVIEETTSGSAKLSVKSGSTFTAVPKIGTACALDNNSTVGNVFQLITDTGFTDAYVVQGRFSSNRAVTNTPATAFTESCAASGGAGGGGAAPVEEATPPAEGSVAAAEEAVNDLGSVLDEIDTSAPLDSDSLGQLDDLNGAIETAADTLSSTVDDEIASSGVSEATVASSTNLATKSAAATSAIANALSTGTAVSKTNLLGALNAGAKASATASKVGGATTDSAAKQTLNTQNKEILTNSATLLNSLADKGEALNTAETDAVRTVATNLVSTTKSLASESTTAAELETFALQANTILEAQEKLGIPANTALIESVSEASDAIATNLITRQLTTEGEAPSDTEIQEALASNNRLLESVLDVAIKVPPSVIISRDERSDRIKRRTILTTQALEYVTAATEKLINPNNVTLSGGLKASDALLSFLGQGRFTSALLDPTSGSSTRTGAALSETSIAIDEATGAVTINLPGESYSASIISIRSIPAVVPQGIKTRSDGRVTVVTRGAAIDLTPSAFGFIEFVATVNEAGFTYDQTANGSFILDIGNNQTFSGAFGYDNLANADLTSACSAISVTEPTGAENAASYAYGVSCGGGVNQRVLPFVAASDFYPSLKASGMTATTDRSTGIIGISGLGSFKPSFISSDELTAVERFDWLTNQDQFGIYMQEADVNGDGVTDIKVLTGDSIQVLYGLQ